MIAWVVIIWAFIVTFVGVFVILLEWGEDIAVWLGYGVRDDD